MMTNVQREAVGGSVKDSTSTRDPQLAADDHRPLTGRGATSDVADRAVLRHQRAKQLAAEADGDRRALEDVRSRYLRRLHRTSDDFDATEGLRTVELALSMTPRPEGLWASRRGDARPAHRWRRRRRRGRPG